ncbi:hypothetical protein QWZ10_19020 [Paracoccus cavernae]|uniref:Uncharacterized protein n=1 Tax=Paracoccus cavernae TaxID=1571207 RepID=A0ABT8DD69_9RHOB|nr:hypothetical protein [Paracoccus cavernae]
MKITNLAAPFMRAFAHPDVSRVATGLHDIYSDHREFMTDDEQNRAVWSASSLETLATSYWADLNALAGQPLPDPGIRPPSSQIHPYSKRTPDLDDMLGFYHRCREFLDRLEVAVEKRRARRALIGGRDDD